MTFWFIKVLIFNFIFVKLIKQFIQIEKNYITNFGL